MSGLKARRARRIGVVTCLMGLLVGSAQAQSLPARISLSHGGRTIPNSFLGLSVEFGEVPTFERDAVVLGHVISLITPPGRGDRVLRIGGKSADHTLWRKNAPFPPRAVPYGPPGLQDIGTAWIKRLASLVDRDRLRVVLDLNLATDSVVGQAALARAALTALKRSRLIGLEIGNEPDLYWRQIGRAWGLAGALGRSPTGYVPSDYRRDFAAYARSLAVQAPGVALGGPEIISAKLPWLESVEGLGKFDPSFLTIHRYASSACWSPFLPFYPSIPLLLDERAAAGLAGGVTAAAAFAHATHQALRLSEVNSISCGGNPGVADTFATALWSADTLFELIRSGVDAVNWHVRPVAINAPFRFVGNGIVPMPELYGLATFARLARAGAELLNAKLSQFTGLHLKVWAVRSGRELRVLIINKGPIAATASLNLGAVRRAATLERLRARAINAVSGVSLAGQTIGADGRWHGRRHIEIVRPAGHAYSVPVAGYSAALLTVGLR